MGNTVSAAWNTQNNKGLNRMQENDGAGLERSKNLLEEKLPGWMPLPGRYPTAIEGPGNGSQIPCLQPERSFLIRVVLKISARGMLARAR